MRSRSRRDFLVAGAAAAAGVAAHRIGAQPTAQPNILWLVSEDNNPWLGAYGDPLAHTPNIDALARRGLLYRNVYSTAPVCAPSRFSILTGLYAQTCSPAQHMRANAHLPDFLRTYPELLRAAGYYCTNNVKTDYNCDVDPQRIWDESSARAHWRNRPAGQPFMAVMNFNTTHESRLFEEQPGRVQPEQVRIPAYLPDTPGMRQSFASYYNLLERMDGEVGAALRELDEAALAEDTIVFYYSDNGGALPRSKRYCYDEGLRCALIVSLPPKWAHLGPQPVGSQITAPVSLHDLAPTLLSIVGLPIPPTMQGKALLGAQTATPQRYAFGMRHRMDERYDFVRTVTDGRFRYIRNYLPYLPVVQYQAYAWQARGYQDWDARARAGTLTPEQRRDFGPRPFEELYDVVADRDQLHNLIDEPSHAARAREMRRALDAHMLEIHDNGFIPEGAPLEGYAASRAHGAYPLRAAMRVAQAAARRDVRKLGLLRKALRDSSEVIRYWGATGLLMLGEQATPARTDLEAMLRADASPQVRIVAAEALAGLGDSAAVTALGALLAPSESVPVRLQALNALTRIGPRAAALLPTLRAITAEPDRNENLYNASTYLIQTLENRFDPYKPFFDIERARQRLGGA